MHGALPGRGEAPAAVPTHFLHHFKHRSAPRPDSAVVRPPTNHNPSVRSGGPGWHNWSTNLGMGEDRAGGDTHCKTSGSRLAAPCAR